MLYQILLSIGEQILKLLPYFWAYLKGKNDEKLAKLQKNLEKSQKQAEIVLRPNLRRDDILSLLRQGKL